MKRCIISTFIGALLLANPLTAEVPIVDAWQFSLKNPHDGWQQPDFDAAGWREGTGGFGTEETPESRVGTTWDTNDIWLRKSFTLDSIPAKVALWMHHDEDAEVFINGKQVVSLQRWSTEYELVSLDDTARKTLKEGVNTMAVHCRQTGGGQFIDVHLIDAAQPSPKLRPPPRITTPFKSELMTKWGAQVTPENAWQEYPRPQLVRDQWQNLNGNWDYAITPREQADAPDEWAGKILVPFCLESKLGGVQRLLDSSEALWYHRIFNIATKSNQRMMLNFEAVDYCCKVFVNGQVVGSHQGGNTPFSLDISSAIRVGDNQLVVRVEDDTEAYQLRGKQVLKPNGIWYTQVSGIWQTVWLESVPKTYIEDLTISTDSKLGSLQVRIELDNAGASKAGLSYQVVVLDGGREVAAEKSVQSTVAVKVENPKLWSPSSPYLYDLVVKVLDANDQVVDQVKSYAGIRTVGKARDQEGDLRFTLNGETIFHWGPLDQGWWPDGLLTPPSDEGMRFDIEYLKEAGFNMIRKHIKVEPRRYYYHCDRLGMMMWQDQVSAGYNPPWTRLDANPKDAEWPDEQHQQFMLELERMIDTLESHPSIVVWVPFNEAWGQHRTVEVGKWIANRDSTRLVNVASGGNFWPAGDVVDQHAYPNPEFPFDAARYREFVKVVGEFGGHGYPVQGHLWDANRRNWGYGGLPKTKEEYRQRYVTSLEKLNELRHQGISAGVYTQTTDVEGEINGLLTYDRREVKIPAKELAELHQQLFKTAK